MVLNEANEVSVSRKDVEFPLMVDGGERESRPLK